MSSINQVSNEVPSSRSNKPKPLVRSGKDFETLGIYPHLPEIFRSIEDESCKVINLFAPTGMGKSVGISAFFYINNIKKVIKRQMYFSIPTVLGVQKMYGFISGKFPTDNIGFSANRQHSKNHKKAEVCLYTTQSLTNHLMSMYSESNDMSDVFVVIDEAHHPSYENFVLMKYCDWLIGQGKNIRVLITTATPNFSEFPNLAPHATFNIKGESKGIEICYSEEKPFILGSKRGEIVVDMEKAMDLTIRTLERALTERKSGHVLVFVPGEPEGNRCMEAAMQTLKRGDIDYHVLCSNLSKEDMLKITDEETGRRKVIFSTNIAESSVTIQNLVVVVDMLLHKERVLKKKSADSEPIPVIMTNVVPLDSSIQRRGRVGRTQFGYYYPICDEGFFGHMKHHTEPVFHFNDKLGSIMSFMCNGLPANDILTLHSTEYEKIIELLTRYDLFCFESNKIKANGELVSRLSIQIDLALFLINFCKGKSFYDCLIPIAVTALISAKETVPNIFYFTPEQRRKLSIQDKVGMIHAKCEPFMGDDIMVDGLIKLLADYKTAGKPMGEWCDHYSLNSKFFKTWLLIFDRLSKELKPEISVPQWNKAFTELGELFKTNDYDYAEIYDLMKIVFPLVLKRTRADLYVDADGVEYQLESMRLSDKLPEVITPVSIYSFIIQSKKKDAGNVQKNIISLAF
jgi:HrpA-like RNA helicase